MESRPLPQHDLPTRAIESNQQRDADPPHAARQAHRRPAQHGLQWLLSHARIRQTLLLRTQGHPVAPAAHVQTNTRRRHALHTSTGVLANLTRRISIRNRAQLLGHHPQQRPAAQHHPIPGARHRVHPRPARQNNGQ